MSSSFNQPKVDELIVVIVHSKIQDSCNPATLEFHATFRRTLVPQNMVSVQRHLPCATPHWCITRITSSFRALVEAIWPTTFHPHRLPSIANAFPGRTLMWHWCIMMCILVCIHRCWLTSSPNHWDSLSCESMGSIFGYICSLCPQFLKFLQSHGGQMGVILFIEDPLHHNWVYIEVTLLCLVSPSSSSSSSWVLLRRVYKLSYLLPISQVCPSCCLLTPFYHPLTVRSFCIGLLRQRQQKEKLTNGTSSH